MGEWVNRSMGEWGNGEWGINGLEGEGEESPSQHRS